MLRGGFRAALESTPSHGIRFRDIHRYGAPGRTVLRDQIPLVDRQKRQQQVYRYQDEKQDNDEPRPPKYFLSVREFNNPSLIDTCSTGSGTGNIAVLSFFFFAFLLSL